MPKPQPKPKPKKRTKAPPPTRLPAAKLAELHALLDAKARDPRAEFDFDAAAADTVLNEWSATGLRALSLPRRRYLACFTLESEVNNGGFLQFLDNAGPSVAKEALKFLEDRGPRPAAALLRRAFAAFPGGKLPTSHEKLLAITMADATENFEPGPLGRKLDRLSQQFYDRAYAPKLIRQRLEYIRDKARHFFA